MKRNIYFIIALFTASLVGMHGCEQHRKLSRMPYDHHHDHEQPGPKLMHSDVPYKPLTPELLERFHGHLGPYVAFGGLIGEHAINTYDVPRFFGLHVTVECPPGPPPACLIDGLQTSLGVTYGKKNIVHIPTDHIEVEIHDLRRDKEYIYTIKPSAMAMLKEWEENGLGVEERGHKLFAMQAEEVLNVVEE